MATTKTEFSVTFSRAYGSGDAGAWRLRITDRRSNVAVVTLELTDENFSRLMGSQGDVPAAGEITRSEKHGMKHEHMRLCVAVPSDIHIYDNDVFAKWQDGIQKGIDDDGDGWQMRKDGTYNHHRNSKNGYEFILIRHVPWVEGMVAE